MYVFQALAPKEDKVLLLELMDISWVIFLQAFPFLLYIQHTNDKDLHSHIYIRGIQKWKFHFFRCIIFFFVLLVRRSIMYKDCVIFQQICKYWSRCFKRQIWLALNAYFLCLVGSIQLFNANFFCFSLLKFRKHKNLDSTLHV